MAAGPIEVKLEITSKGSEVTAKLTFSNKTAATFLLERVNACVLEVDKEVFELSGQRSERVLYKGRAMKRPGPSAGDYLELPPQGRLEVATRLDSAYQLPQGPASFVARYTTYNSGIDPADLVKLESNSASFRLDR